MSQNYYILNTTKTEFDAIVSTLTSTEKSWFSQVETSVKWNLTETQCIVKTKVGIPFKPSFLGESPILTREQVLVEIIKPEWGDMDVLNLPEGYVDDLTDVIE